MHCSAAYSSMEAAVFNMYERNHTAIQERLEELFAVLERLGTFNTVSTDWDRNYCVFVLFSLWASGAISVWKKKSTSNWTNRFLKYSQGPQYLAMGFLTICLLVSVLTRYCHYSLNFGRLLLVVSGQNSGRTTLFILCNGSIGYVIMKEQPFVYHL